MRKGFYIVIRYSWIRAGHNSFVSKVSAGQAVGRRGSKVMNGESPGYFILYEAAQDVAYSRTQSAMAQQ